jgi:hypothetical protein
MRLLVDSSLNHFFVPIELPGAYVARGVPVHLQQEPVRRSPPPGGAFPAPAELHPRGNYSSGFLRQTYRVGADSGSVA